MPYCTQNTDVRYSSFDVQISYCLYLCIHQNYKRCLVGTQMSSPKEFNVSRILCFCVPTNSTAFSSLYYQMSFKTKIKGTHPLYHYKAISFKSGIFYFFIYSKYVFVIVLWIMDVMCNDKIDHDKLIIHQLFRQWDVK